MHIGDVSSRFRTSSKCHNKPYENNAQFNLYPLSFYIATSSPRNTFFHKDCPSHGYMCVILFSPEIRMRFGTTSNNFGDLNL